MSSGIFVTGTDTGVGKTTVACALLRAYAASGLRAVGMKPIAAGIAPGAHCSEDVAALAAAGNVEAPAALRNPYAFALAIAPHLAAREAGTTIELDRIRAAYAILVACADRVVVEGAGGVLVPLGERLDMMDIPRALSLPVLLVVGVRLGCLNHALLSALALRARGLALIGWVANCIDPAMPLVDAHIGALEGLLPAPRMATLPWGRSDAVQWGAAAAGLDLVGAGFSAAPPVFGAG